MKDTNINIVSIKWIFMINITERMVIGTNKLIIDETEARLLFLAGLNLMLE